jgi:hypothetical protein
LKISDLDNTDTDSYKKFLDFCKTNDDANSILEWKILTGSAESSERSVYREMELGHTENKIYYVPLEK